MHDQLRETLAQDLRYVTAVQIAQDNSQGHVWLLGGYVSRTLAKLLHGTPLPEKVDLDFVCEGLAAHPYIPAAFTLQRNVHKNPRIQGRGIEIDLMPFTLSNFPRLQERGLPLTIESILAQAPLTTGAIAYHTATGQIIGDVGIHAVETRTLGVNDEAEVKKIVRRNGWTVEEYVRKKAVSFGFTPVFPPKSS